MKEQQRSIGKIQQRCKIMEKCGRRLSPDWKGLPEMQEEWKERVATQVRIQVSLCGDAAREEATAHREMVQGLCPLSIGTGLSKDFQSFSMCSMWQRSQHQKEPWRHGQKKCQPRERWPISRGLLLIPMRKLGSEQKYLEPWCKPWGRRWKEGSDEDFSE